MNAEEHNSERNQGMFGTLVYNKNGFSNQSVMNGVEIIWYPLGKSEVSSLFHTM